MITVVMAMDVRSGRLAGMVGVWQTEKKQLLIALPNLLLCSQKDLER